MDLIRKVERWIREERLIEPGCRIVVAVSGGPDSVAMLHLLHRLSAAWNWSLITAHVNHGFRPEESAGEAEFVAGYSKRLGIPCEMVELDMPAYIGETGRNPQDAAREKRYAFLLDTARKHAADRIALGHHADDQAETVLMRLLRGTGPSGLTGISSKRSFKKVELVRPLLRIYKEELLHYCEEHDLSYCRDSSNEKRVYTRNRIRLDAMPFLEQFNPRLSESLNRLSILMEAEDDFLSGSTHRLFGRIVTPEAGGFAFSRRDFVKVHPALQRRLITLILDCLSAGTDLPDASGFMAAESIRTAILRETPPNSAILTGGGISFRREYDRVFIGVGGGEQPTSFHYIVEPGDGDLLVGGTGIELQYQILSEADRLPGSGSRTTAFFDFDEIVFPLTVRSRKEGDRIRIAGLNGSKKVKDIFIDEKVPPTLRNLIPIVTDAVGRILWVPGFRRSGDAAVTGKTKRFFCMTITGIPGAMEPE